MERYKQYLCNTLGLDCNSAEDIYNCIKDHDNFICTTNENGLHSYYTGSYYHPSVIYRAGDWIIMYWLFDGKIKDCTHPFSISLYEGQLERITYYSSEKIMTNQPISIDYYLNRCYHTRYNQYTTDINTVIILGDTYRQGIDIQPLNDYDENLFTSEFYPLWDNMDIFKLKFAD